MTWIFLFIGTFFFLNQPSSLASTSACLNGLTPTPYQGSFEVFDPINGTGAGPIPVSIPLTPKETQTLFESILRKANGNFFFHDQNFVVHDQYQREQLLDYVPPTLVDKLEHFTQEIRGLINSQFQQESGELFIIQGLMRVDRTELQGTYNHENHFHPSTYLSLTLPFSGDGSRYRDNLGVLYEPSEREAILMSDEKRHKRFGTSATQAIYHGAPEYTKARLLVVFTFGTKEMMEKIFVQ